MAQNNEISREFTRFTRVDFTALRYRMSGIPPEVIISRLYHEDVLLERDIQSPGALATWLDSLKKQLIALAIRENPYLAESLEQANKSGRWFKGAMQHLIDLGERNYSHPELQDQLAQWFKKRVASVFLEHGVQTVADLKRLIEHRGRGWYRPIVRIGPGKAAAIERWLNANSEHLGAIQWPREVVAGQDELSPDAPQPWVPLERVSHIAHSLSGVDGVNRNHAFCLVSARNDLEAIQAYLYKYRDKPPTHRSYRKELERFLLWCVCVRRIALSSVMVEECEAYKDFLSNIPPEWVAPRAPRTSSRWRPYASQLTRDSQQYAIQVIRGCFEWLVRVRYLGGNPWIAVADPPVEKREIPLQIHRSIPQDIWSEMVKSDGWLDQICDAAQGYCDYDNCVNSTHFSEQDSTKTYAPYPAKSKQAVAAQYRLARAAIFLMGFTGIRREEAARATRNNLRPVQVLEREKPTSTEELWELSVLGKRNKWRTVYLPMRVLHALEAHWNDRGLSLLGSEDSAPAVSLKCVDSTQDVSLLAPVVIPQTPEALLKHQNHGNAGFEPDSLYLMVKKTLLRIASNPELPLDAEDREKIRRLAPHALRHTFATGAAAREMPVDVLQSLLGHRSVQTTSLYVQAEKVRSVREVRKIFEQMPTA